MKNYLAPLGIFVVGNILLLVLFLFLPAIGTAGDTLATHPHISTFWGMSWLSGGIKILVYCIGEMVVLFFSVVAFLKSKTS